MAEDSSWFKTARELKNMGYKLRAGRWEDASTGRLSYDPLYEAKMIHQFDHRWATYGENGEVSRDSTLLEKADTGFEPTTKYWVPKSEIDKRLNEKDWTKKWLIGWRNITNATNERTLIASVIPRTAAGHSLPLMFVSNDAPLVCCLLGNLNSLVVDYCERQKLGGTNLTFQFLFQLPVLKPSFYDKSEIEFISTRIIQLVYTSDSLRSFALDAGYNGEPFAWDDLARANLRAELDAFYARAYGLTRDELRYILDPSDVRGSDHPSETFRVLKNNEIAKYGEYRTRRLVLEAWDRQNSKRRAA